MDQYRYKALSSEANIRLVTILPGSETEDISISLDEHDFLEESPPLYEAVSYVWGSQASAVIIRVGAAQWTSVTPALACVLRHLRLADKSRVVWVDALAIDQSNNSEKSTQVAMMAQIYHLATRVIAWLGPDSQGSDRAMRIMADIGSQVEMDWRVKVLRTASDCKDPTLADSSAPLEMPKHDAVAIYDLISRPWFERLWVRQEVMLANGNAVIRCGNSEVLWTIFRGALICLYRKAGDLQPLCPGIRQRFDYLRGFILQGKHSALWDMREDFGQSKCQDPRDRIYAISHMLYPQERDLCPQPDYNLPVVDVYRAVILQYLEKFKVLELLRECELPEDDTWPSWIPDWSKKASTASMRDLPLLASSRFSAWYEVPKTNILRLTGVVAATVSEVIQIPDDRVYSHEQYAWFHEHLTGVDLEQRCATGCRLLEAYARTLVCDSIMDEMDPAHGVWPTLDTALLAVEQMQSDQVFSTQNFGRDSRGGLYLRNAWRRIAGKTFVRCERGHIGIAPPATKATDKVCVLLGCRVPMILRPLVSGHYRLIGEGFVHGFSKGEAILGPLPKHIRVGKVIQNEAVGYAIGFINGLSNGVAFMDPRMKGLALDLSEHEQAVDENANASCLVHPEILQNLGVNIEYFDIA